MVRYYFFKQGRSYRPSFGADFPDVFHHSPFGGNGKFKLTDAGDPDGEGGEPGGSFGRHVPLVPWLPKANCIQLAMLSHRVESAEFFLQADHYVDGVESSDPINPDYGSLPKVRTCGRKIYRTMTKSGSWVWYDYEDHFNPDLGGWTRRYMTTDKMRQRSYGESGGNWVLKGLSTGSDTGTRHGWDNDNHAGGSICDDIHDFVIGGDGYVGEAPFEDTSILPDQLPGVAASETTSVSRIEPDLDGYCENSILYTLSDQLFWSDLVGWANDALSAAVWGDLDADPFPDAGGVQTFGYRQTILDDDGKSPLGLFPLFIGGATPASVEDTQFAWLDVAKWLFRIEQDADGPTLVAATLRVTRRRRRNLPGYTYLGTPPSSEEVDQTFEEEVADAIADPVADWHGWMDEENASWDKFGWHEGIIRSSGSYYSPWRGSYTNSFSLGYDALRFYPTQPDPPTALGGIVSAGPTSSTSAQLYLRLKVRFRGLGTDLTGYVMRCRRRSLNASSVVILDEDLELSFSLTAEGWVSEEVWLNCDSALLGTPAVRGQQWDHLDLRDAGNNPVDPRPLVRLEYKIRTGVDAAFVMAGAMYKKRWRRVVDFEWDQTLADEGCGGANLVGSLGYEAFEEYVDGQLQPVVEEFTGSVNGLPGEYRPSAGQWTTGSWTQDSATLRHRIDTNEKTIVLQTSSYGPTNPRPPLVTSSPNPAGAVLETVVEDLVMTPDANGHLVTEIQELVCDDQGSSWYLEDVTVLPSAPP